MRSSERKENKDGVVDSHQIGGAPRPDPSMSDVELLNPTGETPLQRRFAARERTSRTMTTTTTRTLNDVDLPALGALIETIRQDPAKADTKWKSTVEWRGGFRSASRSRDFDPTASDEPAALGGDDTAPNPVEQLLGALGNCLAVGYAANATAAGIHLRDLRIELEGDLDLHTFLGLAEGNAGYQAIRADVSIDSDAEPEALRKLHEKVVATSPVGHTLSRPVQVSVELA